MKAYFPPDNNGIQIAGVVLLPDHFVPPALTKTFISESDINEPNTVGVMLDPLDILQVAIGHPRMETVLMVGNVWKWAREKMETTFLV